MLKDEDLYKIDEAVLDLKRTTEGSRKVLIVAARDQPSTIRDADNGLLLRSIRGNKHYLVYNLLRHDNLVYCGTSTTSIPVLDFIVSITFLPYKIGEHFSLQNCHFQTGDEVGHYNAGVGIVCMCLNEKCLLFAACYDGNISVFDLKVCENVLYVLAIL